MTSKSYLKAVTDENIDRLPPPEFQTLMFIAQHAASYDGACGYWNAGQIARAMGKPERRRAIHTHLTSLRRSRVIFDAILPNGSKGISIKLHSSPDVDIEEYDGYPQ